MPLTLQQLLVAIYVFGALTQVIQLGIQLDALRRTPRYSIALLCISTAAGLIYLASAYLMNALPAQSRWMPRLFWLLALAFLMQTILGVWGTAGVLRALRYRRRGPT